MENNAIDLDKWKMLHKIRIAAERVNAWHQDSPAEAQVAVEQVIGEIIWELGLNTSTEDFMVGVFDWEED